MIATFETKFGKYAELHHYTEPVRDADGVPAGFNEVWEVYVFDTPYDIDNSTDFTVRTFLNKVNAMLFLKCNGYTEVVK